MWIPLSKNSQSNEFLFSVKNFNIPIHNFPFESQNRSVGCFPTILLKSNGQGDVIGKMKGNEMEMLNYKKAGSNLFTINRLRKKIITAVSDCSLNCRFGLLPKSSRGAKNGSPSKRTLEIDKSLFYILKTG